MSLPTLYKDDIHQGSVLSRYHVNQLKVGMSKSQVQDLIGSPSVIDPFHNNQWDYINHSTLHEKDDIRYRLTLRFNNEKLSLIDTSGIASLPELTDKEKALEDQRIKQEKAKIEAEKLAKEKARMAKIEAARLAKEKAEKLAKEQALLAEKAKQEAIKLELKKKKAEAEALKKKTELEQKIALEESQKEVVKQNTPENIKPPKPNPEKTQDKPWYQFW